MKLSGKDQHSIRLQVFLSHNGICSRRKAMDLILGGHVKVNGQLVKEPSTQVDPAQDVINVDGKEIKPKHHEYVLLNKPAGYTTTKADPFAEKTVLDLLPERLKHLSPVGRLDKDTEGLLLLTNDGDMVYKLTHPKHDIDKIYFVQVQGKLEETNKNWLERGIVIEGRKTASAKIKIIKLSDKKTEIYITIHEGRKRQIRLMMAKVGHKVLYLKRTAQGPLKLNDLPTGQWRTLNKNEIQSLKAI